MDADGSMAGAGTSRHQADARLAGELAVSLGHIGGSRLVTGIDQLDAVAGIEQRVQHFQITLARHAKRHVRAVNEQLVDQHLSAGTGIGKRDIHVSL